MLLGTLAKESTAKQGNMKSTPTFLTLRQGQVNKSEGQRRCHNPGYWRRWLTLLELLGIPNTTVEIGERLYIGREGREKVSSAGRLEYTDISQSAKNELPNIIEKLVVANEKRFINYINNAQPITPRIHALELILVSARPI